MAEGTTRLGAAAFGVLLLMTVGAFFLANQLKSQPPEIEVIRRLNSFSPNGDGHLDKNRFSFTVDAAGTAAVDVVDADGVRVRRLAERKRIHRNQRELVVWDGRDDDGKVAPDGEYRIRLILDRGRSLLAPRPFYVDTVPPDPAVYVDEAARIVRPGTKVPFVVRGAGPIVPPQFTVVRTDVDPPQTVRTIAGESDVTHYEWDGRTDDGDVAGPGTYLVAVAAFDVAQNKGQVPPLPLAARPGPIAGAPGVTIRRLAVQPPVRSIPAGAPVTVRVDARGRGWDWSLRRLGEGKVRARGHKDPGKTSLLLDAPRGRSALYMLRVEAGSDRATVPIAVHARSHTGPLVVLPMISWLGRDPVDQTGDGIPDVFTAGQAVRFPRLFVFGDGSPPGLRSEIAPLLAHLEARGIKYDLETDLDLAFGEEPKPDRSGVLMAGEPTWISRDVATRLRRYVEDGGRVALFGPDALRATVTAGDAVLARPSPVSAVDALGGRLGDIRKIGKDLTVLAEDPGIGLLEGFSGRLGGFDRVEELLSPGRGEVKTSVGEETEQLRPALSAVVQGKGLVIRVGLPGWSARLRDGDAPVEQLTGNIVDILRHVKPKPRTA